MRDLLERWSRLERQRCEETKHQPGYFGIAGSFEIGRRVWVPKGSAVSLADAGLILAATIEAIEARGFGWALVRSNGVEGMTAMVERYHLRKSGVGDTPAEALLTAYLAALEAEAA